MEDFTAFGKGSPFFGLERLKKYCSHVERGFLVFWRGFALLSISAFQLFSVLIGCLLSSPAWLQNL
jgi:hypothetical protein